MQIAYVRLMGKVLPAGWDHRHEVLERSQAIRDRSWHKYFTRWKIMRAKYDEFLSFYSPHRILLMRAFEKFRLLKKISSSLEKQRKKYFSSDYLQVYFRFKEWHHIWTNPLQAQTWVFVRSADRSTYSTFVFSEHSVLVIVIKITSFELQ